MVRTMSKEICKGSLRMENRNGKIDDVKGTRNFDLDISFARPFLADMSHVRLACKAPTLGRKSNAITLCSKAVEMASTFDFKFPPPYLSTTQHVSFREETTTGRYK
jgi:hypothetical protein